MPKPLVLILFNQPLLPETHPDADSENSVVEIAEDMVKKLKDGGFRTMTLGLGQDPGVLWRVLKRRKIDVIFNLFEGNIHDSETESYVAGLLQWSGIPFTGSPLETLTVARAKHTAKRILKGEGLPTSDFFVVESLPMATCPVPFPVIVKPAAQDASVGVDQASVCQTLEEAQARVQYVWETYGGPVIVEEYIAGRELNVALVELPNLEYLPPAEIIFPPARPGYWPILTYDGKWRPGTPDYDTTPPKYPGDLDPATVAKIGETAMRAYRVFGCRDYARVDFRMREDGRFYILEINPNPEISDQAGFAGCLGSAKIEHKEFVVRVVEQALTRKSPIKPTFQPPPRPPIATSSETPAG